MVNRHVRQELEMAAGIQRTMLPPNDQKLERLDLCWQFHPCVELADMECPARAAKYPRKST